MKTPVIEISVVVCTRNRGNSAVRTLKSLLGDDSQNFEVILIDQSTNKLTEKSISRFFSDPRFRYVPSSEIGTGRARNKGLYEAQGEFVLYTDDDCTVAPGWIETMSACFIQHPKVAVAFSNVEPAIYNRDAGFIPGYFRKNDKLVRSVWDKCRARGIGASMALRRSSAMDIGGFDDYLGPGTRFSGCEDGDIAVRALLNGWWIYETSNTSVIHDGFRTWEEGKELNKRNWVGIGAAYSKPLRCGHWKFIIVVLYEAFIVALLKPLSQIFFLKRPKGLRSAIFFWQGFIEGLRKPIDCQNIRFHK